MSAPEAHQDMSPPPEPSVTNGRAATCLRCKELKARCDRTHLLPCSRCVRLQIPCEAGPPSRQGKRKRPAAGDGHASTGSPDPACRTSSPETWAVKDLVNFGQNLSVVCKEDWNLLIAHIRGAYQVYGEQEPLPRAVIKSALRQACMFATPGENPSLLGIIASVAAWVGVPEAIFPLEIRERTETTPSPVTEYLRSRPSPSYAMARCFTMRHGVRATDAFYRDIATSESMVEWLENHRGGSLTSLFMDSEDVTLIPEAGGRLCAQAATIAHPSTSICVRVHLRSTVARCGSTARMRVMECTANLQVLTNHHFGATDTWFGVEFIPRRADLAESSHTSESSHTKERSQGAASAVTRSAAGGAEQLGVERTDANRSEDESLDGILGGLASVHELMNAFEAHADDVVGR